MVDQEVVQDVLHGSLNKARWSRPRIVKVFVASTNNDFVEERKQLLEVVGPDVQSELDTLGIEVEIVDIFFGSEDEFTWDEQVHQDLLREIQHSHDVSRGCFLLVLVGAKYGRGCLEASIECDRFDQMMRDAPEDYQTVINKYYQKDGDYYKLHKPPRNAEKWASHCRSLEEAQFKFLPDANPRSVLEQQLVHGLGLSEGCNERIVVVMRNWKNYEESEDVEQIFNNDREKQTELLKKYIYNTIPEENRFSFRVPWIEGGIDPDREDHESYLSDFAEVLSAKLHELATLSIRQDPEVKAKNKHYQEVYNEVVAHLALLDNVNLENMNYWITSEPYCTIKRHVQEHFMAGPGTTHPPLFIHGSHVSGKTSILNTVYQKCERWVVPEIERIVRCCATTPRSCYNLELLRVICHQLCFLLNEPFMNKETSYEPEFVYKWFLSLLQEIDDREERVVFIFLDDFHNVNPLDADNKASFSWIPTNLPHNVFIICTVGQPIDTMKFTPAQKEVFSVEGQSLVNLSQFQALDVYIKGVERRLQMAEKRFGRSAFSKLCNLITCAEFGLAEMELLEVLMPTSDITKPLSLAKGYINFTTLASIKYELDDLLLEKQMSGKLLLLWRHSSIRDVARRRYGSSEVLKACHAELANLFFLEITQAGKKEPTVVPEASEETKETPFQSTLPATDVAYNVRHVEEAWIHLLKAGAGSHSGLKDLCVCNFDMALACVQSISIAYLRSLLEQVRSFILDRDLELVYHTLRKCSPILSHDAMQLPTQLICWLRAVTEESSKSVFRMVTSAMAWCDGITDPLLVPLNAWLEPPVPHEIRYITCKGGIRLMETTPSCQHIVVVPMDGEPQLWHIMTNDLVHTFKAHTGPVTCLNITRQTPYLLTGSEDTTVRVWDLKSFQLCCTIREHIATVLCVCSALENKVVISGGEDSRIIMSALRTGEAVAKVDHHRGPVTSIRVTSTGDVIVSASMDKTICLWALEPHGIVLLNTMLLTSPILLMAITEDDVFVLACCEDNQLYLRTLTTGTELHSLKKPKTQVTSMTMACDCQRAVIGGADGKVYIVDLHSGEVEQTISSRSPNITGIRVSDRDNYLIAGGGSQVTFYSFRQDKLASTMRNGPKHHTGRITCVTVSKDGTLAATGATDTLVNIWQLNTHELQITMEGHLGGVLCVSLAPNGLFAVSGGEDNMARVWGLTLGLTVAVYRKHTSPVVSVIAMFDSRRVLSLEKNGTAAIWLADDATQLRVVGGLYGKSAIVSNVMNYCVTTLGENTLRIWSLTNDDERYTVSHSEPITCYVITADHSHLITGSKDQSLKVWTIKQGKLTQVLVGHQDEVTCVAVSFQKDKAHVISGCRDMKLILWDLDTGEELCTLSGHSAVVTAVAISADSLVAVSGSEDKTIIAWDTKKGRSLSTLMLHVPIRGLEMATDASRIAVHLKDSSALPIICLHNTTACYVKMPTYIPPAKDVPAPDLRPASAMKRPARRLLKKEVSLDTYTWQKKYAHLTSNIMMAAVDERLKRRFSVCQSASMEEISKIPGQGSQQLGPEQAALAQSQHFDQLEALWNKRSPPRRRGQLSKQNSRQSDPPTPLEEDPGGISE